jgi:hypothetical protein
MRSYVKTLGLRLPELYSIVGSVDDIDFSRLPNRVVIKPHNARSASGIIIIDGERELLSHTTVPREQLLAFCRRTMAAADCVVDDPRIIVEEFAQDYDRRFTIPRDFKVFVAGGRPGSFR